MEEKFLLNKKIIVLAIFLVSLFAVSVVSAAENSTNNAMDVDSNSEVSTISASNYSIIDVVNIEKAEDNTICVNETNDVSVKEVSPEFESVYETTIFEENFENNVGDDETNNMENIDSEILSQSNDWNVLSLTKTKMTVSNYTVTINSVSSNIVIATLRAKVQTTSGYDINKGEVYFEIKKNYYDKITTYGIGVEKGVASHYFGKTIYLSPGKYKCTAYYKDYSNTYESCTCDFYLTVKTKTSLSVKDITCKKGNTITINVNGAPSKEGHVIYTIGSQTYTRSNSFNIRMDDAGLFKCSATYVGSSYYLDSDPVTFYINVRDDTIISYHIDSNNILSGEKFNIEYKASDSKGNIVKSGKMKLSGPNMESKYSESYSVKKTVTVPNKPGKYYYKIYYDGIYYETYNYRLYSSCNEGFYINVYSASSINVNPIKGKVGAKTTFQVGIVDHLGQKIDEGKASVKINGRTYTVDVNDGKAIFKNVKLPLKAKTYHYTVTYSTGSGHYKSSSQNLKITCTYGSKVTVKSITGYEGNKAKLTAIVKDSSGKIIKKGKVIFKVKGKIYKAKVKNGKAKVIIKIPIANKYKTVTKTSGKKVTEITYYKSVYNCKATFSGFKQYPSSSTKFKVISKDEPYFYSYYKSSSSSSSKKKSTGTYEFNVPQAHATVDVRVYTGSSYNTYSTGTNWLGNGAVSVTETVGMHKVYLYVHYYDGGFKTAKYDGGSLILW